MTNLSSAWPAGSASSTNILLYTSHFFPSTSPFHTTSTPSSDTYKLFFNPLHTQSSISRVQAFIMKVAIITSLLALSTGLTGVLAFPVLTESINLTARGETGLNARDDGNDFVAERDVQRKKKPKNPTWCGAPFCARSPVEVGLPSLRVSRQTPMLTWYHYRRSVSLTWPSVTCSVRRSPRILHGAVPPSVHALQSRLVFPL